MMIDDDKDRETEIIGRCGMTVAQMKKRQHRMLDEC